MTCPTAEEWIDYNLGELPASREQELEEHLFVCPHCPARAETLQALGLGIARAVAGGKLGVAVTTPLLEHAAGKGSKVRIYEVPAGGMVQCTVAPQDEFVVARFKGPFGDRQGVRVEIQEHDHASGEIRKWHMEDVPVDPGRGEVVLFYPVDMLRIARRGTWTVSIPEVGVYTLDHTPWEQLTPEARPKT